MVKNIEIKGLSEKEIKIISDFEFRKKYYFTRKDIAKHFKNKKEMINTLYNLTKKKRIVRLNKNKYFLIPIRARIGRWTDDPFIVVNEVLDGKDYFIGGWAAANYWKLTDQIPFRYDIYTTRRQGNYKILGINFIFHRTTKTNIEKRSVIKKANGYQFRVLAKKETKEWMKSEK